MLQDALDTKPGIIFEHEINASSALHLWSQQKVPYVVQAYFEILTTNKENIKNKTSSFSYIFKSSS